MNPDNFKPNKGKVLVQRAYRETSGILYIPENRSHVTSMFKVLAVGPGCHYALRAGDIIMAPWNATMQEYGERIHIIDSQKIFARFFGGRVFPLGRRVFVKRHTQEEMTKGGILIPEASQEKYQTLDCTVLEIGVPDIGEHFKTNDIKEGDVCRLKEWNETQVEVAWRGLFGLIVYETELLYRHTREDEQLNI